MTKIFVVEDDSAIREAMTDLLESEGYAVNAADNGQIALDYLHEATPANLPDLILLDLAMPVKDGYQFCLEKEADDKIRGIPVIFMSGDSRLAEKSSRTSAVAHILKPADVNVVIENVKKFSA